MGQSHHTKKTAWVLICKPSHVHETIHTKSTAESVNLLDTSINRTSVIVITNSLHFPQLAELFPQGSADLRSTVTSPGGRLGKVSVALRLPDDLSPYWSRTEAHCSCPIFQQYPFNSIVRHSTTPFIKYFNYLRRTKYHVVYCLRRGISIIAVESIKRKLWILCLVPVRYLH